MRAATVHIMFNVLGVALWLPFIGVLAKLAIAVSPSSPGLEGTARLAAEVPRQIANANTLFNVLNTLLFIGFTGWFARITTWLVPDRRKEQAVVRPKFLDPSALDVPTVALEQVRQELGCVGERLQTMLRVFIQGVEAGDRNTLASLSTHRNQHHDARKRNTGIPHPTPGKGDDQNGKRDSVRLDDGGRSAQRDRRPHRGRTGRYCRGDCSTSRIWR